MTNNLASLGRRPIAGALANEESLCQEEANTEEAGRSSGLALQGVGKGHSFQP